MWPFNIFRQGFVFEDLRTYHEGLCGHHGFSGKSLRIELCGASFWWSGVIVESLRGLVISEVHFDDMFILWWYVHHYISLSDHPHWAHHHFSENHHESSWKSQGSSPGPCQVGSQRHWKSGRSYLEWGKGPGHWWAPCRCEESQSMAILGVPIHGIQCYPLVN